MSKTETQRELDKLVRRRVVRLNSIALGVTVGLVVGTGLFIATLWLVVQGGRDVGKHLNLLGNYFIGYRVTYLGSLIGLFYGFVAGFSGAFLFAQLYKWVANLRSGSDEKPLS